MQMLQFTEVADALFTEDSAIEQIEEEQDEQEATAQTQLSCCGEGHIELKKTT